MREPDLAGPCGRAWKMPNKNELPSHQAHISSWLVNRPGAHPFWQWWVVSMIHLRDLPGVPAAHRHYQDAEFEFTIFSIDPERCPNPQPDDPNGYPHLVPLDVVEQFHGVSDADASRICLSAIQAIVQGILSPDQDYRQSWKESIRQTVEHFASGRHTTN